MRIQSTRCWRQSNTVSRNPPPQLITWLKYRITQLKHLLLSIIVRKSRKPANCNNVYFLLCYYMSEYICVYYFIVSRGCNMIFRRLFIVEPRVRFCHLKGFQRCFGRFTSAIVRLINVFVALQRGKNFHIMYLNFSSFFIQNWPAWLLNRMLHNMAIV